VDVVASLGTSTRPLDSDDPGDEVSYEVDYPPKTAIMSRPRKTGGTAQDHAVASIPRSKRPAKRHPRQHGKTAAV